MKCHDIHTEQVDIDFLETVSVRKMKPGFLAQDRSMSSSPLNNELMVLPISYFS